MDYARHPIFGEVGLGVFVEKAIVIVFRTVLEKIDSCFCGLNWLLINTRRFTLDKER